MNMFKMLWEVTNGKYVTTEGISHFWRKEIIFPETGEEDINSSVLSVTITESCKYLSKLLYNA